MLHAFVRNTLLVALLTLSFHTTAAQRTFVATSGSDANTASNCSNTLPCRSFASALTVTDSGGEIIVLTSGGYGPVTINKSVSIIAPEGIYAGISVPSGNGVTIATAGVDVVLRGLTINGLGGTNGVNMTSGNTLTVQNCNISDFTAGIFVSGSPQVRVLDSLMQSNFNGARFVNGPTALLSRSRILGGAYGVSMEATGAGIHTLVEVSFSDASGNSLTGFLVGASSGGTVELNLKDSVATRNDIGVYVGALGGTALATVGGSLISGNSTFGLSSFGGGAKLVATGNIVARNNYGMAQSSYAVLQSTGDNTVTDNITAPSSGTITSLAKM